MKQLLTTTWHSPRLLLWGNVALLALFHLLLTWRVIGQTDQLTLNALCWGALLVLLKRRQNRLRLGSDRLSSLVGVLLLGLMLTRSVFLFRFESDFVRVFPGLALLGVGLLASGTRLRQYWRECLLLLIIMLPKGPTERLLEVTIGEPIQVFTAQFATFILHYLGVNVVRQGLVIRLDQGAVEVWFHCTGIPVLILLLQLVLLLVVVTTPGRRMGLGLVGAVVAIAFTVSSIRVALMALVVANPETFAYWHGSEGSQIFSMIAIGLLGGVSYVSGVVK